MFGLSVVSEEAADDCFTVMLDRITLYEKTLEAASEIDHREIISAVAGYKEPLALRPLESTTPKLPDDSEEHRQWMNSVCSGE